MWVCMCVCVYLFDDYNNLVLILAFGGGMVICCGDYDCGATVVEPIEPASFVINVLF